jgi:fumarylacetoacetate (FAA) hydrolase
MKLTSLPQGRDGRLIIVSNDLAWYADADHIVPTLRDLLDSWDRNAPVLESLAIELEHGAIPRKRFHEREAAAPLPRTFAAFTGAVRTSSDDLRGGRDPLTLSGNRQPAEIEIGLVAVTGDVPQGVSAADALARIRLVGLVDDLVLRGAEGVPALAARHFRRCSSRPTVWVRHGRAAGCTCRFRSSVAPNRSSGLPAMPCPILARRSRIWRPHGGCAGTLVATAPLGVVPVAVGNAADRGARCQGTCGVRRDRATGRAL